MTTATAPAAPPEPTLMGQEDVELKYIAVQSQARRSFPPSTIKQLAESIKARGLINPITLRAVQLEDKKMAYVLVCGERRLRAAEQAGLKSVPARIFNMTDEQVPLVQADENLHREDLTPLDEAHGFRVLLDAGKYDVPGLASVVKKGVAYVTRSVRLLELPKEIQQAIEDGAITPAHGHQLLRIPPADRQKTWAAFENKHPEGGTVRQLQDFVDATIGLDLTAAAFPKDRAYAGEIACKACPYNSANQGTLFDGAEKGKCLSSPCYDKKVAQADDDQLTELRKAYPAAREVGRVNGYVYAGNTILIEGTAKWVARNVFEKRIPKGKFALLVCQPTGEIWLVTPPTPQEEKAVAGKQGKQTTKGTVPERRSAEEIEAERAAEKKMHDAVWAAIKKAPPAKLGQAIQRFWKNGHEGELLKEHGIKSSDAMRAFFACWFFNNRWQVEEVAKALGVKVKA